MKKIFIIVITIVLISSCKDKDQETDILPEATQSGKNTGGAIVDGKVWVAKIEAPSSTPGGNNTSYSNTGNKFNLEITLREYNNETSLIKLYINDVQHLSPKTYSISPLPNFEGYYTTSNYIKYDIKPSTGGFITITNFDFFKQVVSGTFSFKAENLNGEIINVTDGRFDKKYSQ